MKHIQYYSLEEVAPDAFLTLLNKPRIRAHLIEHPHFNQDTVSAWIKSKMSIDAQVGSKVRAILVNNTLAGWCAIQWDGSAYEVAIVLDEDYWGSGKEVFKETCRWAKAMGHQKIRIHLLDTRPEYRFLKKMAERVYKSELMNKQFTTYELAII